MSVVGAELGGAGTLEFQLLPFLFLFGFVELGLDLGLVVVGGGRGLQSSSSFFSDFVVRTSSCFFRFSSVFSMVCSWWWSSCGAGRRGSQEDHLSLLLSWGPQTFKGPMRLLFSWFYHMNCIFTLFIFCIVWTQWVNAWVSVMLSRLVLTDSLTCVNASNWCC